MAVITLELSHSDYWPGFAIYDTESGILYKLIHTTLNDAFFVPEVQLIIVAASASHGENGAGITLTNHDALNIWKELGLLGGNQAFINRAFNAAMRVLVNAESEKKPPVNEGNSKPLPHVDALKLAFGIIRQHNLLITATEEERHETLDRLLNWWNYVALPSIHSIAHDDMQDWEREHRAETVKTLKEKPFPDGND
ncbi:MAG: hypothetical protein IAF02_14700 [Anaerolineae bacterium]|nr:hypothetical protein [Anaerolineae bacterium]